MKLQIPNFLLLKIKFKLWSNYSLTSRLVIPLLVLSFFALTIHGNLHQSFDWDAFFLNLSSELIGIVFTVIYVNLMLNTYERDKTRLVKKITPNFLELLDQLEEYISSDIFEELDKLLDFFASFNTPYHPIQDRKQEIIPSILGQYYTVLGLLTKYASPMFSDEILSKLYLLLQLTNEAVKEIRSYLKTEWRYRNDYLLKQHLQKWLEESKTLIPEIRSFIQNSNNTQK